jgi:hypothetical protein
LTVPVNGPQLIVGWLRVIERSAWVVVAVLMATTVAEARTYVPEGTESIYAVAPEPPPPASTGQWADHQASCGLARPVAPIQAVDAEAMPRTDHVILGVLVISLLAFAVWYRREQCSEGKLRVAAAAGLWALVFWSCTSSMPWLAALDPGGDPGAVICFLGSECQCATAFGDATARGAYPGVHLLEMYRWHHGVIGIRAGQTLALFLLLPAMIWLLVSPGSRYALSATGVGGMATAFAFTATVYYRLTIPWWLDVHLYRTFEVAMLASGTVALTVALVWINAFRRPSPAPTLPPARVVERPTRDF